ncbi:MAG: hypothetical protein ACYCW6_26785, partial [Candidatus Xenobia bacterium]
LTLLVAGGWSLAVHLEPLRMLPGVLAVLFVQAFVVGLVAKWGGVNGLLMAVLWAASVALLVPGFCLYKHAHYLAAFLYGYPLTTPVQAHLYPRQHPFSITWFASIAWGVLAWLAWRAGAY